MKSLTIGVLFLPLAVAFGQTEPPYRLTGFLDASYFYSLTDGSNTFGFDQAEIDITRNQGEALLLRADVDWLRSGTGFAAEVEQGMVLYRPAFLGNFAMTFGRFNAPIGLERLDPPDTYQYSHSPIFDYGLPKNLTGIMVAGPLGKGFDLAVHISNGWDLNTDNNTGKTIGARLGVVSDEKVTAGVSLITGPETPAENRRRTVIDLDGKFTINEKLFVGAELNIGSEEMDAAPGTGTGTATGQWNGFLLMGHYQFNPTYGLTGRVDLFNDPDNLRLPNPPGPPPPPPDGQTWTCLTIAPTFNLGLGMNALFEVRIDSSNEDVFLDDEGTATSSRTAFAFEMTYLF